MASKTKKVISYNINKDIAHLFNEIRSRVDDPVYFIDNIICDKKFLKGTVVKIINTGQGDYSLCEISETLLDILEYHSKKYSCVHIGIISDIDEIVVVATDNINKFVNKVKEVLEEFAATCDECGRSCNCK